jgi:hypothetical protein
VEGLEACYIIRKENRRGLNWYELSHDRLIRPIQRSNADWWHNQPPLLLAAKGWEDNKYSSSYLYSGEQLSEVLATTQGKELDPLVRRFLNACEVAEEDQRKEERSAQELKRWVAAMGVLVGLVVGPTIVTMGALHRLLPQAEWISYLKRIAGLSLAGGVVARVMFHWLQFRSGRAAVLRKVTRKFRLDPSLDALASYSPVGGSAGPAAPAGMARLPMPMQVVHIIPAHAHLRSLVYRDHAVLLSALHPAQNRPGACRPYMNELDGGGEAGDLRSHEVLGRQKPADDLSKCCSVSLRFYRHQRG